MPIHLIGLMLLTCLVVGLMGTTRRLGFWAAFLLSFLITPIGAAVVVILSGRKNRKGKRKSKPAKQ